jgi:hypothetical protein
MLLRCPLLKGVLFGLMCFVCASLGAQANYFNYIVIDPGHGGHDLGGHYGKVYEKHLALDTSMRLEHYLKASGYKTVMTRRSDSFISLPRRAAKPFTTAGPASRWPTISTTGCFAGPKSPTEG